MKINISKLDAARRQLETAIKLFFYDCDIVSIHTLAAASFNLLSDLNHKISEEKKSIRDEVLDRIKKDKKKWFKGELRKAENFFKHADRDCDATYSFEPGITKLFLIDAVRLYWLMTGENTLLTQAYFLWYLTESPNLFVLSEDDKKMVSIGSELMRGRSKAAFFEALLPALVQRGYAGG